MVGCRGNCVRSLGNHSGAGDVAHDFGAGQVPTDTRLCTLSHFDFDCGACIQIFLVHAKSAGSDLYNGIFSVAIEIFMETALSRIIQDAKLGGSPRQRCVGVIADGSVTHCREHNGHGKLQLRRKLTFDPSVFVPLNLLGFLSEKYPGFHWFPQGVNGGIGYLRRIDQDFIPVHRQGLGISHRGQQHAAAACLFIDFFDCVILPVGIFPKRAVTFYDFQCSGGAERHAALAVYTFAFIADHAVPLGIKGMHLIGALPFAYAAGNAPGFIPNDFKFRIYICNAHYNTPSFT
ncbi:hypothetical protein IMSAG013_01321 [Clostridiales bacterium]|nr:hypothetical protein IMSAG013_01321 [Clostridiales bacterium]